LLLIRQQGTQLRFFPTSQSAYLWADASVWSQDTSFLRRYLKPGDKVVDVGANIGFLALISSRAVGESGRIIAIEPHPKIFRFMCANITLDGATNISPVNCAVGEHSGETLLSDVRSDDLNAISSTGISVPMELLDSLTREIDEIALLKIDVEGYEKFVLSGAHLTIAKTRCVYFESSDKACVKYGYRSSDIACVLKDCGFKIFRFTGHDSITPVELPYESGHCENLMAIRCVDDFLSRTSFHLPTMLQLN
jgi:FkbM family methyltransferase